MIANRKGRTDMKATLLALGLGILGLAAAANAAVVITAVGDRDGYDELNVEGFRSTSAAKAFDVDGNDEYGTEGTFFFGTGATAGNGQPWSVHTQTGADWATFAAGAQFGSVSEQTGYGPYDNPTLSGATVADWTICGIGTATAGAGLWAEVLTFTIDSNAPKEFRVGIMSGLQGTPDGRWDPTGLRLSVDGGAATTITNLANNATNDPEWVFFDVDLNGETNGLFSIEGQSRNAGGNTKGTALGGVTFDVPSAMSILSAPTVTNITTTTALGGVVLTETNATVTLFWGESDEGEAFTWDATNALTSEQAVGPITGVAISNLTADTQYFYIFYASNSLSGLTGWSDLNRSFGSALTGKSVTNLSASTVTAREIELSWTDNFNAETGYVIQRSTNGSSWATIVTTAAGASSYTDSDLSGSSTYHYQIAATNGAGLSDWSSPDQATTPATVNQIDTDFTEATFGDVGILRDVPNPSVASITLDDANDRLVFAATASANMWATRADAPIGYILKPDGPRWFMEAEIELGAANNGQVFGFTVYEDTDGANPDFSYGLDFWAGAPGQIRLQGLVDNDPNISVSAAGQTRVTLRIEAEDDGGGTGVTRYAMKYDLGLGEGMRTLTTYDTGVTNARVGVVLKTSAARTTYVHNLEIADVPASQPLLSNPTVTNISSTTAMAGVTLAGTNADLALFWGESDEGEAFTWDETNFLPTEQTVGSINGVAISNLTVDTRYYYIFYASNSFEGLTDWSEPHQSFDSALAGKLVADLSATAASALQIDLSWTDNFNTETGFAVQRSLDGSAWATLATTAADASSYADTSVSASSTYHYRVAATNGAGFSDWSDPAQATTPGGTTDPHAPDHWWKIDEPSGTLVRDFGLTGGMDGTILGTTSTRVTPANSRVGNALDVSTGWSYIDAGTVTITNSFTANIWVDPNDVAADWRGLMGKWNPTGQRVFWFGQHSTDGYLRFGLSSDGSTPDVGQLDTTAAVIGNNCWQMITAVWDETTKEQKLYVNGVLKASAVRTGALTTPRSSTLKIMALNDNSNQFLGTADDARLYARALSDGEIRALYANPGVDAPQLTIMARDDFDGPELETGWTLDDREVADAHDLAAHPGWLRVEMAAAENTWLDNREGSQMLYTDAPDGSFTMETRVDIAMGNGGSPVLRSSGGLVVHDPSYRTAQFPFALYFWLGNNPSGNVLALQKPGTSLATAITGVSTHMYLRLYRNADDGTWTASYKVDVGDDWTEWVTIADTDLPTEDVSDDDIYVGIMTKTFGTAPANIDYDYFDIPEAAPPIGGTLLIIQ